MNAISFRDQTFSLKDDETVLDGLLREGYEVSHGCRAGVCQSCVMVCEEGEIPLVAQKGLKDSQKELGHFLACQCKPDSAIKINGIDQEGAVQPARVIHKSWLNDHIICLRLEADVSFRAGQYCTLWKDGSLGRCYSAANTPEDGYLEFHIKVLEDGQFSQWINNEVSEGQTIGIQGAMGTCFYQGESSQPLFMAAIGTGLAPIYGILKEALSSGHEGPINLLIGAKLAKGFYLVDELQTLASAHPHFNVHFVSQEGAIDTGVEGSIYDFANQHFKELKGAKAFLCGAESFVKKMKRQCFMNGANMQDIYSDSFVAFG